MKRTFTLLLLCLMGIGSYAQNIIRVAPGPVGVLNDAIEADTLADGSQNPNTIFELTDGAPYLLRSGLEVTSGKLHIRAEAGAQKRPLIIFSPDAGGDNVSNLIVSAGGDMTFEGVHITGRDVLGGRSNRLIRLNGDNARIVLDNCLLDDVFQSAFRLNADGLKVFVTNCIFNRIGTTPRPDNGRWFDNRGQIVDTLVAENNVVYFVTQRVYRSADDGILKYGKFNQNTIYTAGYSNGFQLTGAGEVEFTNNVYVNGFYVGRDSGAQLPPAADTIEDGRRYWILPDTISNDSIRGLTGTQWTITNNNLYYEQAVLDLMPRSPDTNGRGDTIVPIPFYPPNLSNLPGFNTNISEPINFNNPPPLPTQYISAFHNSPEEPTNSFALDADPWPMDGIDFDPVYSLLGLSSPNDPIELERYSEIHDLCYSSTEGSYSAGSNGQPIGALNICGITVSSRDLFVENNIAFYPNPVDQMMTITNLENTRIEQVDVYDLMGRLMMSRQASDSFLQLNTANLTAGTYILTVRSQDGGLSSRKFIKK